MRVSLRLSILSLPRQKIRDPNGVVKAFLEPGLSERNPASGGAGRGLKVDREGSMPVGWTQPKREERGQGDLHLASLTSPSRGAIYPLISPPASSATRAILGSSVKRPLGHYVLDEPDG